MTTANTVPKPERKLNPRQERFASEYLVDLNATEAAKRAGYSERTAYSQGCDLLKKPEIRARVDAALADVAKRCGLSAEWVVKRLMALAQDMQALAAGAETEDRDRAGAASAANRALELLGKYQKMFTEKHEIAGAGGAPFSVEVVLNPGGAGSQAPQAQGSADGGSHRG